MYKKLPPILQFVYQRSSPYVQIFSLRESLVFQLLLQLVPKLQWRRVSHALAAIEKQVINIESH
jgi:hypothetical protein